MKEWDLLVKTRKIILPYFYFEFFIFKFLSFYPILFESIFNFSFFYAIFPIYHPFTPLG